MRTLKNILTLMLKEFRSVLTDPVLMVLIAYIFTATITQMAQVSSDVKNATVGIIDLDRSVLSMRIRDAIQPPYFKPPQDIRREDADEMMDKGEILFVLEIPPGFQRDTEAGRSPKMQLLIDATSMTQSGVGSSYLTQIANRETNAFAGRVQPDIVVPVINTKFNPNGESSWFMPTSQIGTMAFMLLMLLAGAAVIRERERGTIEHLLVMPVNAFELMMGKILANGAVILVAAVCSLWFVVHLGIGVPLAGSVGLYAAGLAVFLFSVASLGIMIATFAPTMGQFGMLMLPVYIVMNLFAGGSSPRDNMPRAAQIISEYWPLTQFMKFSQNILFRGAGLETVWVQMLIMALIGAAFLGLALLRFRKMLEQQG
ncbi:Inner membrane transport permease yhhJ [Kingella potus]|uniref:Inner membrane transport permease yhhJ n=1 Tax=Kingella potus TaxID=265175 RepID=A0A377R071_9NEIS|nr:ABC transporter permease [Kingella potus]STR00228.1 Inner membrane transport permease yhhJ [Kingella potus]